MKIKKRSGFTMVEMLVVFMVMSIFVGVSVPPMQAYYENTSYKDVQNRAETVFYAAQQTLTSMSLSSQIEPFFQRIHEDAETVDNVLFEYLELTDDSAQDNRYYAVRYKKSDLSNPSEEGQLVLDLLQNLITEKDIFNASIAIEVDSHTYTIQTVFYSLEDVTFTYGLGSEGSDIDLRDRAVDTLKLLKLGMAEANVSYIASSENFGELDLQEPFIATDIELKNPDSGYSEDGNGGEDGDDNEASSSFFVYIKVPLDAKGKATKVQSLRIHWNNNSIPTPNFSFNLWYRQQNQDWFKDLNSDKTVDDIDTVIRFTYKTKEIKIELIPEESSANFNFDSFVYTIYSQKDGLTGLIPGFAVSTTSFFD